MELLPARLPSAFGDIGVAVSERGLCRVALGIADDDGWLGDIAKPPDALLSPARETLVAALAQMREYLAGKRQVFDLPLDLHAGTEFQREVWHAIGSIPCGDTRTYGQVAQMIGKPGASRAVGAALGRNPVPIVVPCHRVVATNGSLGGFSAGQDREQGQRLKRALLAIEGHQRSRPTLPGLELFL